MAFASLLISPDLSPAQEFLNPNVGGCGMGTNKTVVDRQVGGRSIQLPADGTVGTITFADDAIADGTLDAEIAGSCRQEGNKVTVVAKGRVVNRAAFTSNTQASAGFSLNMRPHAKPFNTDYLLRAAGSFAVTWDRGAPGALGGASAGFSMTNCDPGGNKSLGAGAGPAVQGVVVSSGTVECRRRSGNPFGFLESDVPISFGASVHQFAGAPQEFSFEGTVVFELLRVGKEIRVVSGPTEGSAGSVFPEPFVVSVVNNGNNASVAGESIQFRLLDSSGAAVQTAGATTAGDGKASVNFTPPAGGIYRVEAVCAGCPASSQELGQGSKVVFPPITVEEPPRPSISLAIDADDLGGAKNGDRGLIGESLLSPLRVKLAASGAGANITGVSIVFSTVSAPSKARGQSLTPANIPTDALGRAHAFVTLGNVPGEYVFKARCDSCDGEKEVMVAATAEPVPTLFASLPEKTDGGDGLYVSITGPGKFVVSNSGGCHPVTLTASGIPEGGTYSWRFSDSRIDFSFDPDRPNQARFCVRGPLTSAAISVVYSRGGESVRSHPFTLTPQVPSCVSRRFFGALRCADAPGNAFRHGVLFGYKYIVKDQDSQPLLVPPNEFSPQLVLDHDFVITNDTTGDLLPKGGTFPKSLLLHEREGVYLENIGQCLPIEFPPDYAWHSTRDVLFDGERLLKEFVDFKLAAYVDRVTDANTVTTLPDPELKECEQ